MLRRKIGVKERGASLLNLTKKFQSVLTFSEIIHRGAILHNDPLRKQSQLLYKP